MPSTVFTTAVSSSMEAAVCSRALALDTLTATSRTDDAVWFSPTRITCKVSCNKPKLSLAPREEGRGWPGQ